MHLRVLAVHGSPRAGGNTDQLIEMALGHLGRQATIESRHLWADRLQAAACLACGGCDHTGQCVLRDDMAVAYDGVRWAQAMVIGAPVFFASVPAQLKLVIDRHQCAWVAKYRLGRPWNEAGARAGRAALLLSAGAMRRQSHLRQVREVVRAWTAVIDYRWAAEVAVPGADRPGEALAAPGLDRQVARAAADLLTLIRDGGPQPDSGPAARNLVDGRGGAP